MSKEQFFKAGAVKTEPYKFPNGYETQVRGLTLAERSKFLKDFKDDPSAEAYLVAIGCEEIDENDIEQVRKMPSQITSEISALVIRLSGLGDEDPKKALEATETSTSSTS